MLIRLVRPMKRKGVSQRYFVQRIHADVKSSAVGSKVLVPVDDVRIPVTITGKMAAVRVSLRTADASEAKVRQDTVAAHLERIWAALRTKPRTLTQKEATALSGEVYKRSTAALEDDDPGDLRTWQRVQQDNLAALAGDFGGAYLLIGDDARRAADGRER